MAVGEAQSLARPAALIREESSEERLARLQHGLCGANLEARLEFGELLDDTGILQLRHRKHGCAEESLPPHFDRLARRSVANRIPEGMREVVYRFGEFALLDAESRAAHDRRPIEVADPRVELNRHQGHLMRSAHPACH